MLSGQSRLFFFFSSPWNEPYLWCVHMAFPAQHGLYCVAHYRPHVFYTSFISVNHIKPHATFSCYLVLMVTAVMMG